MAFVYGGAVYTLKWEDGHELHGLEVRLRSLSVGEFLTLTSGREDQDVSETFKFLSDHLVGWNLQLPEVGEIPATFEGVKSTPIELVLQIVSAWTDRIVNVPAPLVKPSPTGSRSGLSEMDLASLPMAVS